MILSPISFVKHIVYLAIFALILIFTTKLLTPNDELVKVDAIIAISGGETATRTNFAIDLYEEGWAPKLIFSGDAFDPLSPSNADVMRQIATLRDVPAEDIVIDESSDNTEENAENAQGLIDSLGYEKVILVTGEYHQRRAYMEFTEQFGDVEVINAPANEEQWNDNWWWLSPTGWRLTLAEMIKVPITFIKNIF